MNTDIADRLMYVLRNKVVIRSATGLINDGQPISLMELLYAQFPKPDSNLKPALLRAQYGIRLSRHSSERAEKPAGDAHLYFQHTLHLQHDVSETNVRDGLVATMDRWSGEMPDGVALSTIKSVSEWVTAEDFVHIHTHPNGRSIRTWDQVGTLFLFLGIIENHLRAFVLDCRKIAISTDDQYANTLWNCAKEMHARYAAFLYKAARATMHI